MDISKYAGAGQDTIAQQESMPMIKILQDMSPEVNKRNENYIEGAEAGMLLFNKDKSLIPAPANIIPLASKPVYVEWTPRDQGGGMVATHPLSITNDDRYKKVEYTESLGGNDLIYTVYWMLLLESDGEWINAMIAMTKTQLKVSRKLAELVAKFRYEEDPEAAPPTFARSFNLGTSLEKNKAGQEFFNFSISPNIVIEDEALLDTAMGSLTQALAELPAPAETPALVAAGADEDAF
jgi:hypothetical protein